MADCEKVIAWIFNRRPVLALISVVLIIVIVLNLSSSSSKTVESPNVDSQNTEQNSCEYAQGANGDTFCSLQLSWWNWVCKSNFCNLADANEDTLYPLVELNDKGNYVPTEGYKNCEVELNKLLFNPIGTSIKYAAGSAKIGGIVIEYLHQLSFGTQDCPFPLGSTKLLVLQRNKDKIISENFFAAGGFESSYFVAYNLEDSIFVFDPAPKDSLEEDIRENLFEIKTVLSKYYVTAETKQNGKVTLERKRSSRRLNSKAFSTRFRFLGDSNAFFIQVAETGHFICKTAGSKNSEFRTKIQNDGCEFSMALLNDFKSEQSEVQFLTNDPTTNPTLSATTLNPNVSPTTSSPTTSIPTTSSPTTSIPTSMPTNLPSSSPTTSMPTEKPTIFPTATVLPTISPSKAPTIPPTMAPDLRLAPNIIFIFVDDIGVGDTSVKGFRMEGNPQQIQTPNLERMARDGAIFLHGYSSSPVCGPSRASFLIGKHTGHSMIRGNAGSRDDFALPPGDKTVAEILREKGYHNYLVGKWGFGGYGTEPSSHPLDRGFHQFLGQFTHREAHINMPEWLWNASLSNRLTDRYTQIRLSKNADATMEKCTENPETCDFAHDIYTEEALKYISKRATESPFQPFFLMISYSTPHVGSWKPDKDTTSYEDRVHKIAPKYSCSDSIVVAPGVSRLEECMHSSVVTNYIDRDVGRILDSLEEHDIAEKTLVVFAGDNGPNGEISIKGHLVHDLATFKSTAGQRGGKRQVFEGGIRTPLMMQYKGMIPAGTVERLPASLEDLFTTFVDVGRATHLVAQPSALDGVSLLPTLTGRGDNQVKRKYLYFEHCALQAENWKKIRSNPDLLCSWALRRDDGWKLVYNYLDGKQYLFDLKSDPFEQQNLYEVYPELVSNLTLLRKEAYIPLKEMGYEGQINIW